MAVRTDQDFTASGHRFIGHDLERAHHRGVIPRLAAVGCTHAEQLLCARRMRQGDSQLARAVQCEVQILLVQFDAKARIERTPGHALTMHL